MTPTYPTSYTFTVDTGGEALIVQNDCGRVRIGENAQAGTASWTYTPIGGVAITIPAGAVWPLEGNFRAGQNLGTVTATSGSMTFMQLEDGAW